jgi:hypothetical protein
MLDRQEAELIEEFGRIRDDTDHYAAGAECFVCRRPWPCPEALGPGWDQPELGAFHRETDTVRPDPRFL